MFIKWVVPKNKKEKEEEERQKTCCNKSETTFKPLIIPFCPRKKTIFGS